MRAQIKGVIVALALLVSGVLVSPSAQVSIQRGWNVVSQYMDIVGTSATYKWVVSGTSLLLQASTGGAFSTVGTFTSGGALTLAGGLSVAGQVETPGGVNLALNPNTGLVTVGGSVQVSSTGYYSWSARSLLTSGSDGNVRVANAASTNTYDLTLADWGTTSSAESASVANDAVLVGPTSGAGFLVVSIGTDNNVCTFALTGTAAPVEINDPGTLCSTTATTASSINVYYSAGYQIENKRGGTRALRIQLIGG